MRLYTVFNAQQCELPERLQSFLSTDTAQEADTPQKIDACEQIVANMPARSLFLKAEHYYSVLFHELTYSRGHMSRLDRATLKDLLAFGDTNYSREELTAEMGAVYLCGVAGIENETVDNSAAYIQGWLRKLRTDKKVLV